MFDLMITTLKYVLVAGIFAIIHVFITGLYMKLLLLKWSFKCKTKIYFRPIVGYQPLFRRGETEGDSHAFFYKIMRENPDVKIIITNFLASFHYIDHVFIA